MSLVQTDNGLQLPETLQTQLYEFRKQLWWIKITEAVCGGLCGVVLTFLVLFALDRVWETPGWARAGLFAAVISCCAMIPLALHRWVWGHRRLEQLARLLTRKHPHVGDQLLGIVELVRDDFEQARSLTLCRAAIRQVAEDAEKRNFRDSVPRPRHGLWIAVLAVSLAIVFALLVVFPAAGLNAWVRLLAPWRSTPRYTFAALEPLPSNIVVAHGEPFLLTARLKADSLAKPTEGSADLKREPSIVAPLQEDHYAFNLPSQIAATDLRFRIGDWRQTVRVEPMARPELTSVIANVSLPPYLGRPGVLPHDVRGGAISPVNGSRVQLTATASRELASSEIGGRAQSPEGNKVTSQPIEVTGPAKVKLRWQDHFGLTGKEPFILTVAGHEDEAPTVICEGLPRQKVVLDSETLTFKVRSHDDFGVKSVGMEWQGVADVTLKNPAVGESILAAGGNDKEDLEVGGTFSAKLLGIEPQLLQLRIFAEDYLPGRKRAYSNTFAFYVLNAEQHAIWLTHELSKWHRQSLDVRDREMQLYETNKQLRALSPEDLDRPESRRRIEDQSASESANGRRLSHLVTTGEDLVKQATRNPEFGVGHLEKWAEMLQILKDIAANRMPSVADLLKQASLAQRAAVGAPSAKTAMVGQIRSTAPASPSAQPSNKKSAAGIPAVVDQESSQQSGVKESQPPGQSQSKPSNPRLGLPMTSLVGSGGSSKPCPAGEKLDEAIKQQKDLLAEFEKVADELKRILAQLEGSTFVKRLKAASRLQYIIAGRIGDQMSETFGLPETQIAEAPITKIATLAEQEVKGSDNLSLIMDDLAAYFDRHRHLKIKTVLDDMRKQDVVGNIRQLGSDMVKEKGLSIAQCEFWSDTLDRWAEDLVDPACRGACPGCKSKGSLPPSIVLEVLQILEGEINLREETRTAEQAHPSLSAKDYGERAAKLSKVQNGLHDRTQKVIARIRQLPDAQKDFAKEIYLLESVDVVMQEAEGILARPNTGTAAIGAETEVIELLLRSRRFNPKAGGGGGSSPGGGGGGTTHDSALTLLGSAVNAKEVREDRGVSQTTGELGSSLPEEFRTGLDEYFNRLERRAPEKPPTR